MSEPTASVRPAPATAGAPVTGGSAAPARGRQLALLGVLTAILAALVIFVLVPALSGGGGTPGSPAAPSPAAGGRGGAAAPAPRGDVADVRLERLEAQRLEPGENGRNPFRMGAAPAPTPAGGATQRPAGPVVATPDVGVPVGPPPPPPLPPIPFRFIGIVTGGGQAGKIAVLSDGRAVVSGKEGDTVDGRFRIVRIGEESIQMEYVDGRGRQTIRLTGGK